MASARSEHNYHPIDRQCRIPDDIDGPKKSVLHDISLDVIFEIFSYLHPLDLIRLTLTSKALRNILMSTTSVHVWRSARLTTTRPTPGCPPDQNEPRWARVLYETNCMMCDSSRPAHMQWTLRLRGCKSCLNRALIKHSGVIRKFPIIKDLIQPPKASSQSKSLERHSRIGQDFPQVEDVNEILRLLPFSRRAELPWRGGEPWYHRASVKKTVDILVSFQEETRSGIPGAKERLDAFKTARTQEVLTIMNPEPVLKEWIKSINISNWPLRLGGTCGRRGPRDPYSTSNLDRRWTGP